MADAAVEVEYEVDDAGMRRALAKVVSQGNMRRLNEAVGARLLERTKDHLAQMSVSRHKVADRLGAPYTRYFEDAPGRTSLKAVDDTSATVAIKNTPGLVRAFHDLDIAPTGGKKWLTIPLSRVSYGKRVADLRGSGHELFRPGKARILAEQRSDYEEYVGKDGKKRKRKRLRPLYALVKSVRVPRDEGLLPTAGEIAALTKETATDFLEVMAELA